MSLTLTRSKCRYCVRAEYSRPARRWQPRRLLADFKESWVDELRELHADPPPYEEWREREIDTFVDSVLAEESFTEIVIADLGLLDALFAFLGLATAYGIASGGSEGDGESPVGA